MISLDVTFSSLLLADELAEIHVGASQRAPWLDLKQGAMKPVDLLEVQYYALMYAFVALAECARLPSHMYVRKRKLYFPLVLYVNVDRARILSVLISDLATGSKPATQLW